MAAGDLRGGSAGAGCWSMRVRVGVTVSVKVIKGVNVEGSVSVRGG